MYNLQSKIAELLATNQTPNQSELAREFGVARSTVARAIKKQLLSVAGDSASGSQVEENIEDYEVNATKNGAVSATPLGTSPVAVGDIWRWGKGETPTQGLIVAVYADRNLINVAKTDGHSTYLETQVVSFKNWKKRPNLNHYGVEHNFIAAQSIAMERGLIKPGSEVSDDSWYGVRQGVSFVRWDEHLKDDVKPYNFGLKVETDADKPISEADDTSDIEVTGSQIKGAAKGTNSCPFKLTVSKRSITAVINAEVLTVTADEASFEPCLEAVKSEDWARVEEICRLRNKKAIDYQQIISRCGFTVQGGYVVMGNGTGKVALGGIDTIVKRLNSLALTGDEAGVEKIGRFVDKVLDNPDPVIMNRIVDFIKFADVEIDDEGNLITYKYVNSDYLDSHSRTLINRPGSEVFMKRILVDADIENECSRGLHVCALSYAFQFWGSNKRLVKCKLNPRDIVAIPRDYKGAKIRCCRYLVTEDVTANFLNRKLPMDFKGFFG